MCKEEDSYILIWLHGYYGGQANNTTIGLSALEEVGKVNAAACGEKPDLGLMTVVNKPAAEDGQ